MKTTTTGFITHISKEKLNELLQETKETLAKGMITDNADKQKFGVVDLWNLRKHTKTTTSLRRFMQY